HGIGRYRILLIAMTCASWAIPSALDWLGLWLEPAYRFEHGVMTVLPRMMEIPEAATRGGLSALFLAGTIVVAALLWGYSAWVAESRARLHLQAWHLENVVPRERRLAESSRPPPPIHRSPEPAESREDPGKTRWNRA
ncbi:MAG: hypothetical protein H5U40_14305, partial [Polyangiaceae bacterium]|nr:hypothetical protein [Polyangiaceae bacterium]